MKRLLLLGALLTGCAHAPPTGILVLHVQPRDARVLLDDQYIGSAAQLSGHRLRINAGVRRVEVTAEGHYAQRREAALTKDGRVELQIDLHPVPDGVRGD